MTKNDFKQWIENWLCDRTLPAPQLTAIKDNITYTFYPNLDIFDDTKIFRYQIVKSGGSYNQPPFLEYGRPKWLEDHTDYDVMWDRWEKLTK